MVHTTDFPSARVMCKGNMRDNLSRLPRCNFAHERLIFLSSSTATKSKMDISEFILKIKLFRHHQPDNSSLRYVYDNIKLFLLKHLRCFFACKCEKELIVCFTSTRFFTLEQMADNKQTE